MGIQRTVKPACFDAGRNRNGSAHATDSRLQLYRREASGIMATDVSGYYPNFRFKLLKTLMYLCFSFLLDHYKLELSIL
jgi:hypothetical protein